MIDNISLATVQRSLGDPEIDYPLWPPLTKGCPRTSNEEIQYPLEIAYDYERVDTTIFDQAPLPGLGRWSQLLPPLVRGLEMAEGGTPLVALPDLAGWAGFDGEMYVKDESRNPTWSHKDRLNLCTVSAAVRSSAPGVVVSSSGNHGASAAAYSARAGLPCIVFVSNDAPPAIRSFVLSYGAAAIAAPRDARWMLMSEVVKRLGYHPVSNLTSTHTGHPFGPEGYKTIAWEIFLQLGRRVPAAVFIPTGYAEMLYGVWKGFEELRLLGLTDRVPRLVACEPASRAPLTRAFREGKRAVTVEERPTVAYAIGTTVNGYRGIVALGRSDGFGVAIPDESILAARDVLARQGLWVEASSAISLAGLRQAVAEGEWSDGPVVCITTSSGFKDEQVGQHEAPVVDAEWSSVVKALRDHYGLRV